MMETKKIICIFLRKLIKESKDNDINLLDLTNEFIKVLETFKLLAFDNDYDGYLLTLDSMIRLIDIYIKKEEEK